MGQNFISGTKHTLRASAKKIILTGQILASGWNFLLQYSLEQLNRLAILTWLAKNEKSTKTTFQQTSQTRR
jgi:hypothetical protein